MPVCRLLVPGHLIHWLPSGLISAHLRARYGLACFPAGFPDGQRFFHDGTGDPWTLNGVRPGSETRQVSGSKCSFDKPWPILPRGRSAGGTSALRERSDGGLQAHRRGPAPSLDALAIGSLDNCARGQSTTHLDLWRHAPSSAPVLGNWISQCAPTAFDSRTLDLAGELWRQNNKHRDECEGHWLQLGQNATPQLTRTSAAIPSAGPFRMPVCGWQHLNIMPRCFTPVRQTRRPPAQQRLINPLCRSWRYRLRQISGLTPL